MAQARFSIRMAIAEGFDFWRRSWRSAVGSLTLLAGVMFFTAFQSNTTGGALLGVLLIAVVQLPAMGALYRIALQDLGSEPASDNGPLGLQWKGLEMRLLGVLVLSLLLSGVVLMVAMFIAAAITAGFVADNPMAATTPEALMESLGPNGRMALNFLALLMLVGVLILAARLSMATPATVAERRVRLLSSLAMTKGAAAPILATLLIVNAPVLLLETLGSMLLGRGDPMMAAAVSGIVSAIGVYFYVPISVGAMAHIYRRLRGGAAA